MTNSRMQEDFDRFKETQYRVVEALTGKPRSAQIASHNAAMRKIHVTAAEKIRRGRPVRVRARRPRRRSWLDEAWDIYDHLPVD